MNINKDLLRLIRLMPFRFAFSLFAGTLSGFLLLIQAFALSLIISEIFLHQQSLVSLCFPLISFLVILIFRGLLIFFQNHNARLLANQIKTHLRNAITNRLLKLGPVYSESTQTGKLAVTAMQGVENLESYFSQYLPQLFFAAVVPILILIVIFPLDLLTGIIFLLTAPLIPIFMYLIGKSSERLTKKQWLTLQRLGAHFLDTVQALKTLKLLNQGKSFGDQVSEISEKYRQATLNVLRVTFLSALVLEMVATLSTAIVAVQIGLRLLNGAMGFQQALFILIIAPEFYLPLRTLGLRFHAGMSGVNAARSIFAVLNHPISHTQSSQRKEFDLINTNNEIDFNQVGFTYPGRGQAALSDISFELQNQEFIAVVGPSGSGKSTIFNLLLRFIEADSGEITFNGKPMSAIDVKAWRKLFAWIPQKPYLFFGTIEDNIRMGDLAGHTDKVIRASLDANLHEFIMTLPKGYDTMLGERGQQLSGGQAQRLAIARAFFTNAPILLMDEPISRLDPFNKAFIQESVEKLRDTHTVLMIAHHIDTVKRADRILFIRDGHLIGDGKHEVMVAQNMQYRLFTENPQVGK